MELSKPSSFEDNLFTDHPSQENPSLQLPPFPRDENQKEFPPAMHEDCGILNSLTQMKFFQEYKKIYSVAYHLHVEKQKLAIQLEQLFSKIASIDSTFSEKGSRIRDARDREIKTQDNSSQQNRAKRSKRSDCMLEKYKCKVEYCERFYSSEGSLQQHIKLKHPELDQVSECNKEESADLMNSF